MYDPRYAARVAIAVGLLFVSASVCLAEKYVVTTTYRTGKVERQEFFDRSAAQSAYNLANLAKGSKLLPGPVLSVTLSDVATPGGITTLEYKQRISDSYETAKTLEKEQSNALDRTLDNIFNGAEDKAKSLADVKATSEIAASLGRAKVDAIALSQPGAERTSEMESLRKLDVIGKLAEETVREDEFYRQIETTLTSSGFYRPKVVSLRKELANTEIHPGTREEWAPGQLRAIVDEDKARRAQRGRELRALVDRENARRAGGDTPRSVRIPPDQSVSDENAGLLGNLAGKWEDRKNFRTVTISANGKTDFSDNFASVTGQLRISGNSVTFSSNQGRNAVDFFGSYSNGVLTGTIYYTVQGRRTGPFTASFRKQ